MYKKKMAKKMLAALTVTAMVFGMSIPALAEENPEEVTLSFLGWKTGKEEGAIPEIIKAFEEANPELRLSMRQFLHQTIIRTF